MIILLPVGVHFYSLCEPAGQSTTRNYNNRICLCCDVCQKQHKCGKFRNHAQKHINWINITILAMIMV